MGLLNFKEALRPMLKRYSLLVCFLLTACAMVGPDYQEPTTQVLKHWANKNASVNEKPFQDKSWWQVFHDPVLTDLINQGYSNNLPLQAMGVKILQARAVLAQTTGELYPQQQAIIGDFTYHETGGSSLQHLLPATFSTNSLGFTAAWELDFWGKYRRAIQAKDAAFLASSAAYNNALVTLTGDIATAYINLRGFEEQIKVTKKNIQVQTIGLKIATSRYKEGQTSLVDVEQAQAELSQTQASLPGLINQAQQQKNALNLLLGLTPNTIDQRLKQSRGIPRAPKSVAMGIPVETLVRRPDIHQARWQAIEQAANIGVVKAELYPALSLSGTFSFASSNIGNSSLSDLFNWSNRTLTTGPSINWSVLNYGQITNAVRAQDAVFEQSLLNYANLVLKAQKEVEDALSAYIQAQKTTIRLGQANQAATKSFQLALIRYKEGETDFTPVLNAEQQQLSIELSLAQAQTQIPQALVALYHALGGGWEFARGKEVISPVVKQDMAKRTNWGGLLEQKNHEPARTVPEKVKQIYLPTW